MTEDSRNASRSKEVGDPTSRGLRLVNFLRELARLRAPLLRDVNQSQQVLWLHEVPREDECVCRAWEGYDAEDEDVWLRVRRPKEPPLPNPPAVCKAWIDEKAITQSAGEPRLFNEVVLPAASNEESTTRRLVDAPAVRDAWDRYVESAWRPWSVKHRRWRRVQDVYERLFAIYKDQQRLGEQYELLLGIGLLVHRTPSGHDVRRHLVTARASLEFDVGRGVFTVAPGSDGPAVTVELDMLDIGEQPTDGRRLADDFKGTCEDPWERPVVDPVLRSLVQALNARGEYLEDAVDPPAIDLTRPLVGYSPALILRKRSSRGLVQLLERIHESIKESRSLPSAFERLCEVTDTQGRTAEDLRDVLMVGDEVEFFPLPTNQEQRRIIQRCRTSKAVLVQGPPGTGKSHTIVNLICHMLATGQRVLVTAQTPRALRVLEEKLPEQLQPLCVGLLGDGLAEQRALEKCVSHVLTRRDEWDPERNARDCERLERSLAIKRDELRRLEEKARRARSAESETYETPDGRYKGTAGRIAERLEREAGGFAWFEDCIGLDAAQPASADEVLDSLGVLSDATADARMELRRPRPSGASIDAPEDVARAVAVEREASRVAADSASVADARLLSRLERLASRDIVLLRGAAESLVASARRLSGSPGPWMARAVSEVFAGSVGQWRERERIATIEATGLIEAARVVDATVVDGLGDRPLQLIDRDASGLRDHLKAGKGFGLPLLRAKAVKQAMYLRTEVRVDGQPADRISALESLLRWSAVVQRIERLRKVLPPVSEPTDQSLASAAADLEGRAQRVRDVVALHESLQAYRELARELGVGEIGHPPSLEALELEASTLLATQDRQRNEEARCVLGDLEERLARFDSSDAHPAAHAALLAVRSRDVAAYRHAVTKLNDIDAMAARVHEADRVIARLEGSAPRLAAAIRSSPADPLWPERLGRLSDAWSWARARSLLRDHLGQHSAGDLTERVHRLRDEIGDMTANVAALRAWRLFFERLRPDQRAHLVAWQQAIRKYGKGTGKHAATHRRNAQRHLAECRSAIPAWVMPLHRLYDTVVPEAEMFDVVIVDEASQCGPEALPLFYLAKTLLVVGDDKQISPESGFVSGDAVQSLIQQELSELEHRDSFSLDSSLFDHAKLRFGNQIVLREHFRCMPEIIRFSNDLCYSGTPLIPLRQYPPLRLEPLVPHYVADGFREGSGSSVVNRVEAEAVVKQIVACCSDPRYEDKTFGVITLQGDRQAKLIESMLLRELEPEDIEDRRLLCGDAYSFQGDERDVMFLSMVAAPNETIGALSRAPDERRFNVAVSRARDQLWLFHSVQPGDLSELDLRRRLLEYVMNPALERLVAGVDLDDLEHRSLREDRAIQLPPRPFDSWFEVDVFLRIVGRGYRVVPQYPTAGCRIDLMVEGTQTRLAVECDGDAWHGDEEADEDTDRQRKLERAGLRFFRVRDSEFYSDRDGALATLWVALQQLGIFPAARGAAQVTAGATDATGEDEVASEVSGTDDGAESADEESTSRVNPTGGSGTGRSGGAATGMMQAEWHAGAQAQECEDDAIDRDVCDSHSLPPGTVGLKPYTCWRGAPLKDPREATPAEVRAGLLDVVRVEGPVLCERAYGLFAESAGIRRVGRQIRSVFNAAAAKAIRAGLLVPVVQNAPGQIGMVVRVPEQPEISVRERGPRQFGEIPRNEIVALMRSLLSQHESLDQEALFRMTLDAYGLQRLGSSLRQTLESIHRECLGS